MLLIKAKFASVESGLTSFDDEWLAHIVVPGEKRTVGAIMQPRLASAYASREASASGMAGLLEAGR